VPVTEPWPPPGVNGLCPWVSLVLPLQLSLVEVVAAVPGHGQRSVRPVSTSRLRQVGSPCSQSLARCSIAQAMGSQLSCRAFKARWDSCERSASRPAITPVRVCTAVSQGLALGTSSAAASQRPTLTCRRVALLWCLGVPGVGPWGVLRWAS